MSALRSLRQLTASSIRTVSSRVVATPSSLSPVYLQTRLLRSFSASATRAFSSSPRSQGEGSTDIALAQKLQEEVSYEKEAATTTTPEFLQSFQSEGVWKIDDIAGNDEVTLTRTFGNESIRLMFSIADIEAEQESEFDQEQEQEENTSSSEEDQALHTYPIRCSLSITKSSTPGSLTIDAVCQEGAFVIENISFFHDAKLATELTAEADWKRRGLYIGPQFDTLDVAVQDEFEKFLQERGINETLAQFIPEYAEHKEQTEYVKWLESVKTFVEN